MKYCLYVLILSLAFNCKLDSSIKNKSKKTASFFYSNGQLRHTYEYFFKGNDTIKINEEKEFYENGVLQGVFLYDNSGTRQKVEVFFINGQKKLIINYKNNLKHGVELRYYQSGNIKKESYFENGLLHGECIQYYDVKDKVNFKTFTNKGGCYMHQYEYNINGNIKTYAFCNPVLKETRLVYSYENNRIVEKIGSSKPILAHNIDLNNGEVKGANLDIEFQIFSVEPVHMNSILYYRILGLNDFWSKIDKIDKYQPYTISQKINKSGDYQIQIKQVLYDSIERNTIRETNSLQFKVVD